jgi:hypothetical protein
MTISEAMDFETLEAARRLVQAARPAVAPSPVTGSKPAAVLAQMAAIFLLAGCGAMPVDMDTTGTSGTGGWPGLVQASTGTGTGGSSSGTSGGSTTGTALPCDCGPSWCDGDEEGWQGCLNLAAWNYEVCLPQNDGFQPDGGSCLISENDAIAACDACVGSPACGC